MRRYRDITMRPERLQLALILLVLSMIAPDHYQQVNGFAVGSAPQRRSATSTAGRRFLLASATEDSSDERTTMRTNRNIEQVVTYVQYAARQAGDIMLQTAGQIAVLDTKSNAKDLVTESDIACQAVIEKLLKKGYPNDLFLGEENVDAGSDASEAALAQALESSTTSSDDDTLLFIVDPIDGTTNFQAGLPIYCVSIGIVHLQSQQIVGGVIYNPALQQMTTAIHGQGAFCNGKKLGVLRDTNVDNNNGNDDQLPLAQSLVNVGFPVVKESTLKASSLAVAALATKVRGLRMMACASQVMAWVAQDVFQVYTSWDLNAWDVAAGICIVREAGGSVMDFEGNAATLVDSRDLIITSPTGGEALGLELRQVMEDAGCMEYE